MSEKEKLAERIKDLEELCRLAEIPEMLIENPGLIRGKAPTNEDVKWAYGVIDNDKDVSEVIFLKPPSNKESSITLIQPSKNSTGFKDI